MPKVLANINGRLFEEKNCLERILFNNNFVVNGSEVFKNGKIIGYNAPQYKFYSYLMKKLKIDWKNRVSKKRVPDEAFLNLKTSELFIFEKKVQYGAGSVDEKIQTCDFKLKIFKKLLNGTNIKVSYTYIFNDWFKNPKYADELEYIENSGCFYFFNQLPIECLNLH